MLSFLERIDSIVMLVSLLSYLWKKLLLLNFLSPLFDVNFILWSMCQVHRFLTFSLKMPVLFFIILQAEALWSPLVCWEDAHEVFLPLGSLSNENNVGEKISWKENSHCFKIHCLIICHSIHQLMLVIFSGVYFSETLPNLLKTN